MTFLYIIFVVNAITWISMFLILFKTPLLDDKGDK
jgi:hypothetical protein